MKFLVVDDHPLTREGTSLALLNVDPEGEVLEAENLAQTITVLSSTPGMNLVLLDLDLSDSKGIDTLKTLKAWCVDNDVDSRIVVLSGLCDPELVRQVIDNFATGFILKAIPKAVFQSAIALTLAGGVYIPEVLLRRLAPPLSHAAHVPQNSTPTLRLTAREAEVAALLVQGFTYKQIARGLERIDGKPVSDHTVRAHVGNIAWKLGVTENAKSGVMAEIARRGLTFPRVG
jgi:DNA-binding NarL/FixJ family response regulator